MQLRNQFAVLEAAVALQSVNSTGVVVEPCCANPWLHRRVQTSGNVQPEACSHQSTLAKCHKASPVLARMSNLALSECPNLLELKATYRGVEVSCMLDSGMTHSFVHPHVVEQTSVATSKGQKLTVTIANGSTSISDDMLEVGLVLTAQGDSYRQVTAQAMLYVLDGL